MEKLCLVLAVNVLWIVPSPDARVEIGPRVAPPGLQRTRPAPVIPEDKGGRVPGDLYRWITIEINGTLDYDDGGLRPRIPEFGVWVGYSVTVDGKWYGFDFANDKELEEKAKKLNGRRVLVKGRVEERNLDGFIPRQIKVVVVSDLEATVETNSVTETMHLEIEGDLESISLMGPPPGEGWMVKTAEQTFHLQFSPELPKEIPSQLKGKKVIVTGTRLDDLTILVTGLRDAALR